MTIRELCDKQERCKQCPYYNGCPFYYAHWETMMNVITDNDNELLTKAIIETARILQEDNNDN